MDIREALSQLDTLEDEHWTQDGAPKTEVVAELLGKKVTRKEIVDAAPKFTRENPVLDLPDETPPKEDQEPKPAKPVDTTVLEEFADQEPMLPEELANNYLQRLPHEQLPAVENVLIEQQKELENKQRELDEMKRKVKLSLSVTRVWIKRLIPDMSNQEAIQEYIGRSQQSREERARKLQEALGGLKPKDLEKLDPRATIDKAFSRKNARGANRPKR